MRRNALILVAHDPDRDPRVGWIANSLAATFDVCEVGIYEHTAPEELPTVLQVAEHRRQLRVHRNFHRHDIGPLIAGTALDSSPAVSGLLYLQFLCSATPSAVIESVGGTADEATVWRFRDLSKYLYNTNAALLEAVRKIDAVDLIVACDLDTVPAAASAARLCGCPFIYDAHEFWPHAFPKFTPWEIGAWSAFERLYMQEAAYRITVSDPLAEALTEEYGVPFQSVPNAVPLHEGEAFTAPVRESGRSDVIFLYQGGFADLRGVELLIDAWPKTAPNCILHLRGPDSSYKDGLIGQAQATGLLGSRIFFPDAVRETELVEAAMAADVGLISYEPRTKNHIFCCPNKLSQYMAAGLPVLANDLIYVADQIRKGHCGISVPFDNESRLLEAVRQLAENLGERVQMGANGRRHFETAFNWDQVSTDFVAKAQALAAQGTAAGRAMDFSWADTQGTAFHPDVVKSRFVFWSGELSLYANELERLTRAIGELRVSSNLRRASKPFRTGAAAGEGGSFVDAAMVDATKRALVDLTAQGDKRVEENQRVIAAAASLRARLASGERLEDLREARPLTETCMRLVRETSAEVGRWVDMLKHFDRQAEAVRLEGLLLDSRREFERFCRQYREAYGALATVASPQARAAYAPVAEVEGYGSFLLLKEEGRAQLARIQTALAGETAGRTMTDMERLDLYVEKLREVLAPLEALQVFYNQCIRRVELARLLPAHLRQLVIGWDTRLRWAKVQQLRGWRKTAVTALKPVFGTAAKITPLSALSVPTFVRVPSSASTIWSAVQALEEAHAAHVKQRPAGELASAQLDREKEFAALLEAQIAVARGG